MGLSGLEKVLVFLAFKGEVHQMEAIINLTPTEIWDITRYTFGFGLVFFLIGTVTTISALKRRNSIMD